MVDDVGTQNRVLDEELLRFVARQLGSLTLVDRVSVFPSVKPESVVARLDRQYYPKGFERVFLELRAYTNGEFHISYVEDYFGDVRSCRWDRHDLKHSTRDHFQLLTPSESTEAEDRDFPDDLTSTLETVVLPWVEEPLGRVWMETR